MCIDGNNAPHVTTFVNAQLQSLWEIGKGCAEHYDRKHKLSVSGKESQGGYDYALREFNFSGKSQASSTDQELRFSASFHIPSLEFVCDHSVILHLKIDKGRILTMGSATLSVNSAANGHTQHNSLVGLIQAAGHKLSGSAVSSP